MDPYLKVPVLLLVLYMAWTAAARSTIRPNKLLTYALPENRGLKISFGYTEDTYLNFTELATKYQYKSETHKVTTTDGYVLTVFRLLPKCSENVKPYPVLLVHGIYDTSDLWILAGPEVSLGYILSRKCYDVWAANLRGNVYSRKHIKLNPNKDLDYWDFSFDEHGNYDLPALVDYILNKTGKAQLFYFGHSQGTTDILVMNSMKPEYNQKVRLSVLLAPIAWMGNIISPVPLLGAYNVEPIQDFLEKIGFREIFGKDMLIHHTLEFFCHFIPELCELGLALSTGHRPGTIKQKTLSLSFGHLLSGSSTKTLYHLAQLIVTGKFQRYDEGKKGNLRRYGTEKPPEYNVTEVSSPVLLVSGKNDWVSSLKDVDTLASKLPNLVENLVVDKDYWSHHNHVWDDMVEGILYGKILDYLEKYS